MMKVLMYCGVVQKFSNVFTAHNRNSECQCGILPYFCATLSSGSAGLIRLGHDLEVDYKLTVSS